MKIEKCLIKCPKTVNVTVLGYPHCQVGAAARNHLRWSEDRRFEILGSLFKKGYREQPPQSSCCSPWELCPFQSASALSHCLLPTFPQDFPQEFQRKSRCSHRQKWIWRVRCKRERVGCKALLASTYVQKYLKKLCFVCAHAHFPCRRERRQELKKSHLWQQQWQSCRHARKRSPCLKPRNQKQWSAFSAIVTGLNKLDATYFLCHGTLLLFVRECTLLQHQNDYIDIGISLTWLKAADNEEDLFALLKKVCKNVDFNDWLLVGGNMKCIYGGGMWIDLYTMEQNSTHYTNGAHWQFNSLPLVLSCPKPAQGYEKFDFRGLPVLVPVP